MSKSYDDWMAVSPWQAMEAAPENDRAMDATIKRMIDTMLELQLVKRHDPDGWPPISITALAGQVPGGGGQHDQVAIAAMKSQRLSGWHLACRFMMKRLPEQDCLAMLMQAARVRPEKMGNCFWAKTNRELFECQAVAARYLGMTQCKSFASVQMMQRAATSARKTLRHWIKQGHGPKVARAEASNYAACEAYTIG